MAKLLRPDIALGAMLVMAAFTIAMFFEGYRDIHYAPAALSLLAFACLAIIPSFWKGLTIPSSYAAMLVFALWFYVTLSLSWSSVPFASLVTYLIFIACPLTFFAPLLTQNREGWLKITGALLFAAIALAALWAVIQFLFLKDMFGPRAHHPLPNPNNMAGLINLGLLPAFALFMTVKDKSWLFLGSLLLVLVLFAGLVATGSRGGLLAALLAASVLALTLRAYPPVLWQRLLILIVPALMVFIALNVAGNLQFGERLGGLVSAGTDQAALARMDIWRGTWQMFLDHFWLGAGLGTFYLYYPSYRLPGADNSAGSWAHMDPLQYGAEMGVIAPLLFYALCVAVLLRTLKALKALPQGAADRAVIMGLFCALLAMVLHTHATFHLYIMPILIVTGTWLALWYHFTAKALPPEASYAPLAMAPWQRPFLGVVTIAIAGLIGIMAVTSALGQHHLLRAHNLIRQGLAEQFVAAIEVSEKWAPHSFIDSEVQLAAFYIDLLGENSAALFTPEEQEHLFEQTKAMLDIAQSQNPAWGEIDYKRGKLYSVATPFLDPEAPDKAIASMETAIEKNRMHFSARQDLATLYLKRGFVEKAYDVLAEGLRYPHSQEIAHSYERMMGDIKGLVDMKRAYDSKPAAEEEYKEDTP